MWRCLPVILVLFGLSACNESPKRDLASCKLEAYRTYRATATLDEKTGEFIATCMEAKGYRFALGEKICALPPGMADNVPYAQQQESCSNRD